MRARLEFWRLKSHSEILVVQVPLGSKFTQFYFQLNFLSFLTGAFREIRGFSENSFTCVVIIIIIFLCLELWAILRAIHWLFCVSETAGFLSCQVY